MVELGTSASAPIFASIVNRLNEERILAGKGPMGFLNPTLYSHPEMFNDIVEGYNLGCNSTPAFYTTKGWDPGRQNLFNTMAVFETKGASVLTVFSYRTRNTKLSQDARGFHELAIRRMTIPQE